MRWFWFVCLTAAAAGDMRDRSVSGGLLIACGIGSLICWRQTGIWSCETGLLAGAVMLAASRLTRGAIGAGDGWFVLAGAGYLKAEEVWILLLGGFGVSWVVSTGVLLRRIWTGETASKDTVPLLACMWPAGMWIMIRPLI